MIDVIERLARQSGRYQKEAFYYVAQAIESAHDKINNAEKRRRHISGQELVDEIIRLALEEFGFLGRTVFNHWGIDRTEDIGEIVFLMVENGILSAQKSDSKEDFINLCNLSHVFEDAYRGFELD